MTIHVFTSQSIEYFNSIGKYSLASVLKYLPEHTKITITTEDFSNFPKLNPRINVLDLYSLNNGFKEFEDRWTGKTMKKVISFAKKGHTILHAVENFKDDIMIWLDADAFIKQPITEEYFTKLLNGNLSAHLGVMHDSGEFCVESGFFVFDLKHSGREQFAKFYRNYYDNDLCENMGRFYDSNVHGHAVQDCEKIGIKFTEMNLKKKGNTPIRGSMVDSYAGHFKGKVKKGAEQHYKELGIADYLPKVYL
jgi:hypothetical protein